MPETPSGCRACVRRAGSDGYLAPLEADRPAVRADEPAQQLHHCRLPAPFSPTGARTSHWRSQHRARHTASRPRRGPRCLPPCCHVMMMELGGSALLYDPGGGKCGRPTDADPASRDQYTASIARALSAARGIHAACLSAGLNQVPGYRCKLSQALVCYSAKSWSHHPALHSCPVAN
jgi:hypothetical protein